MSVNIDEGNLKYGLLGLVVALVEIIQEVLERQAVQRMEKRSLNEEEIERLGSALADLKDALNNIKKDYDIEDVVRSVRDGLDQVADEALDKFVNVERWGIEKA